MCQAGKIKSNRPHKLTGDYYAVVMKERARIMSPRRLKKTATLNGAVNWGPLTRQVLFGKK